MSGGTRGVGDVMGVLGLSGTLGTEIAWGERDSKRERLCPSVKW